MTDKKTKTGRVRRYDQAPLAGFANPELASRAAWLRELAERVYDQIEDLPPEALDFSPGETLLSIGRLVLHLAWAEASWVSRLTGEIPSADLQRELNRGRLDDFGRPPAPAGTAAGLIAFCRRVQENFTAPALARVTDIDSSFEAGGRTVNVRGVVAQLEWHWAYHSGQVGLLRLLWGSDYQWTNEAIVGLRPTWNPPGASGPHA
jgi:uncharacterized damage-inducible protein DinB